METVRDVLTWILLVLGLGVLIWLPLSEVRFRRELREMRKESRRRMRNCLLDEEDMILKLIQEADPRFRVISEALERAHMEKQDESEDSNGT